MSGLALRRTIVFTRNLAAMRRFYQDVIGLAVVGEEPGWVDFDAGGVRIALHETKATMAEGPIKLAFYAEDVAAMRETLAARGATTFGPAKSFGSLCLCDGFDPDGNAIQLSNRP